MNLSGWLIYFIQNGVILGYFPYSLILYLLKRRSRFSPNLLNEFDHLATLVVIYSGLIISVAAIVACASMESPFHHRSSGGNSPDPRVYLFLIQLFLWLLTTQLLRIRRLQKRLTFRAFVSLFGGIAMGRFMEKLIILLTSMHRDYLPSSWVWYMLPLDYLLILLQSILGISLVTTLVYFVKRTFRKNLKNEKIHQ